MISTQFFISNLFQNVLTKRDLLFTAIDSKRGNVSKNQIKSYINEMVNLIKSEKINYEKSDNSLIDITLTPTQNTSNLNSTSINIDIEESVVPQNSGTNSIKVRKTRDDYKNLSSEEKVDLIFHKVLDLTSKVDTKALNKIQTNCNPDQQNWRKRSFNRKPQPLNRWNNLMSRKNGSHDSNNYKTGQKTYSSRNFYPIYENFDNYYRYLINGQQLLQPLPNYNYRNFLF